MVEARLAVEVGVTWLAAAGSLPYLYYLRRSETAAGGQAALFLAAVLGMLLAVRGFAWIDPGRSWLRMVVLGLATLLPLASTLFVERILRRHHPVVLKVFALGVSAMFFMLNLVMPLAQNRTLMVVFGVCFALVVLANGWMMVRAGGMTEQERRLVRALLVVAVLGAPLLLTDFNPGGAWPGNMRLGGLAALIFFTVMLTAESGRGFAFPLLARLAVSLLAAVALASFIAWLEGARGPVLVASALQLAPLLMAVFLFGGVVTTSLALSQSGDDAAFLQWMGQVPLAHADAMVSAMHGLALTRDHLRLQEQDIAGYDRDVLWRLADHPVSLAQTARLLTQGGASDVEAAEQWQDLLQRHGMNHGLAIRRAPALIVLLQLPAGSRQTAVGARLGVVHRIARRLADEGQNAR